MQAWKITIKENQKEKSNAYTMKLLLIAVVSLSLRLTFAAPSLSTKQTRACVDLSPACKTSKSSCWEKRTKKWMHHKCRKTCQFCDPNQECNLPLGVTSANSNDSEIISFSFHDWDTFPTEAKLNSSGGYRANKSDPEKYKFVRVTFTKETILTGVATQGFGDPAVDEWVKKYVVSFVRMKNGEEQKEEEYINDKDGRPKTFQGNNDIVTIVRHNFKPVNVKTVSIWPQDYHNNVAFRFELYGCTMKKSVVVWLKWKNQSCTLEMLWDVRSEGFKEKESELHLKEIEMEFGDVGLRGEWKRVFLGEKPLGAEVGDISRLPGVQVVSLEHLRPDYRSVIVEIKVGGEESQMVQMTEGVKKIIKSSTEFDHDYLVVKDPQATPPCNTPNISEILSQDYADHESLPKINRSTSYTVKALITSHTDMKAKITWKVAHLLHEDHTTELQSNFQSTKIVKQQEVVLKSNTTTQWEIYPRTLNYGLYYVQVRIEMKNLPSCINYNYGFLKIESSPLQAIISTEPSQKKIVKELYKELQLNASGTFDPDVDKADKIGLRYTWICARQGEKMENIASLPVIIPSKRKQRSGGRGCYGNGPGKLNFTGSTAVLFLDGMVVDKDYIITLIVEKDTRKSEVSYNFTLTSTYSFSLGIGCKRNCKEKVDTKEKMIFEGLCIGEVCKQSNKRFTWLLYRKRDSRLVTLTNNNNLKLLEIEGNVLAEGEDYELQLHGYLPNMKNDSQKHNITTNESPRGGNCTVDKYEGTVLETNFTFTCSGWNDTDKNLLFQFGYLTGAGAFEILQEGTQSYLHTNKLPLGDSLKDNTLRVDIYVKDEWGGYANKSVNVKVHPSKTINMPALYQYTIGNQSEMAKLLKSEDGGKSAMRLANTLLSVMSAAPENEFKTEDKIKLKNEMIRHSSKVKVDDLQGLLLVTSVVASATNKREELSEESQKKAVDVLENMANKFQNISLSYRQDTTGIQMAGNNFLVGIGNVLNASSITIETNNQVETNEEKGDKNSQKANATKTKVLAQKAWNLIGKVGDSMLATRKVHDKPLEMETKAISMVLNRQNPDEISKKPSQVRGSNVTFPAPNVLLGSKAMNMTHVDSQILSLENNPFSWEESAKQVGSAVVSIDLKNDKGELLNVSGLSQEIELNIKTGAPKQSVEPKQSFVKPSINNSMQYHKIKISSEGTAVTLTIVPQNETTLQIYVRHFKRPMVDTFDYMTRVPDFASCKKRTKRSGKTNLQTLGRDQYYNCTRDPYVVVIPSNVTGKRGAFFIGIRLPYTDDTEGNKRRRRSCSGNGRQKRSEICVEFKDPPTTPPPTPRTIIPTYDPSTDVNYTLAISMATCLYWSETKEKWTSEGCRAGPNSANGSLQCLCTHLSAFGGDLLVAPNPIDFDKVWHAFSNLLETKNFVVIGTVCAIFGLYTIAVVFARGADRSDSQKVTQVIPLGDMNADYYCYELTIYTGLWRRCGTSANVAIMIYGEDRDTDVIPLNCNNMCNKKLFARGSVNTFKLSLKESLGDLSHIKIWHDNSGNNPQWFINKVVIRDPKTDTTWVFMCNRWLAAERDDGKIERVLYLSTSAEISSFRNKFYSRATLGLGDGHIWLSVITRPPTSPFTRVQRLSCCYSVLMSAMVTNAMFYQFGAEETSNAFQIGPLIFSWKQITIGIQSAVLVVPVNVLIVFIFRNIRSKHDVTHAYDTNTDNPNPAGEGTRKSACKLPRFFLYVGWAICILVSMTSAVFTIFYSMMWGTEVSNKWLTSILVSFTQDVLFIQPIKVIIVASLLAFIIKKAPADESIPEYQKSVLYSKVKGESHEPLKPDQDQLRLFREYRLRVLTMAQVAIELFFYLTFAWALMVICYGRRNTGHYWMTNGIDELLPRFNKIRDTNTFWAWTRKYFVPAMYDLKWYNGQPFQYKDGFVSDLSNFMVGMPRFRQLRVKSGSCPIAPQYPEFRKTLHPCFPPYKFTNEDQTRHSMPKWREIPVNETAFLSEFELRQMCPRPWRYNKAEELHTIPIQGLRAIYGGGGFVADLGYTKRSALRVIHNLQNNSWIDERTRAVFIEFMIFDSSTSLFSAVSLLMEVLPLGGVCTSKRINTMSLYGARTSGVRSFNSLCELIVIVVVCYFIIAEIVKVCKKKCTYFKSVWSYVEMAQILSATATVVLSIFRRYHTSKLVHKIHTNPFKTSSFHYVVLWSDFENVLMSILVFILTVKVLKILKFNQHISTLASSMARCKKKIISYSAVFMVAFLAFMQVALLVFGSTTKAYSSVSEVFRSQFGMFIGGETNYQEVKDANRIIGPFYFFFFMTAMASILINMFLAILNETYRDVRIYPADRDIEEYKMLGVFLDYAKNKFGSQLTSMKNTKFYPEKKSYSVKLKPVKSEIENKYTPINWSAYDFCQKTLEEEEATVESSFFKDIKRCLQNVRRDLKEMSLLPRSRKYEVHKIQKQFDAEEKSMNLKSSCRGLGLERISSKCSLLSLSESTMYLDRHKGRNESIRKRLLNYDDWSESEDDRDWESDDEKPYAESMGTFFRTPERKCDPDRETIL